MNFRRIVKTFIPTNAFKSIEPYGHLGEAVLLNTINGFPAKGLKVIGVTGTNGKTTTAFLIHRMLHEAGYKVGMMTTVAYGAGMDIKPQMTHMTTSSVPVLLKRIKELRAAGIEWLVLETTSHALAQHRVWGIPYSVAVMTNITHEHLAYHGTFERYVAAKKMMFTQTNKNKQGLRIGIANADDPNGVSFASATAHPLTYGVEQGDIRATNIQLGASGVQYQTTIEGKTYNIACKLPGSFNVYNSLAAVSVGHALGLTEAQVEQGIAALESVEGRMTRIQEGQDFDIIVDYAHSPDSFEKLFSDLRPVVKGKLITLFGSLGGGDVPKRALQGELAGKYADEVIITEEDNRQEDPNTIFTNIAEGVTRAGKTIDADAFIIPDRREAIAFALGRAQKGDTVLFLGKGHEKTIERATETIAWNEAEEVRTALRNKR
ncbi:MAG TPA: UDP-N-acetylmuramoyl-L-alanyl-D-glutamate--2,6-diaminopimelate ligase [Candidatus Saccharimonadales bacterium]|nr:UDP-N-acetylmuramoyl-L-alanyl-D-glutamate--2,6-diaminopimelate ligase [Candidatus Saccharimonadales bacterium]